MAMHRIDITDSATADKISLAIANHVGDAGFYAGTCAHDHENNTAPLIWDVIPAPVGSLCSECVSEEAWRRAEENLGITDWDGKTPSEICAWAEERDRIAKELEAHPEDHPDWIIRRGGPRPYASNLDLLVPVVTDWCREPGRVFSVGWHQGRFIATVVGGSRSPCEIASGTTASECALALAKAFAAIIRSERYRRSHSHAAEAPA